MSIYIDPSSTVEADVSIGVGSKIWGLSQIRSGANLGDNCIVGRNVYIGSDVKIGNNCKIQNNVLIYEPADISNGVFIGPGAIFTNDKNPRATTQSGELKSASDWQPSGVVVEEGVAIGAGAICVAPVIIGRFAMIASGAVVTKDVAPFALMAGVPARQIGWVSKDGFKLEKNGDALVCPVSGMRFKEEDSGLQEIGQ